MVVKYTKKEGIREDDPPPSASVAADDHGTENRARTKSEMYGVKQEMHDAVKQEIVVHAAVKQEIVVHAVKNEGLVSASKVCKKGSKGKGGRKKEENMKRILAYMVHVHETLGPEPISKQEIAEVCGYERTGSHGFFYAYKELRDGGMISGGKLTDLGFRAAPPKETFSFQTPKTNEEKQESFYKLLRKKCKEGTNEKTKLIFDILSDGKPHTLEEFTNATGYANLKSKGLGYNLTCMEKDMKIVKKVDKNTWQFTDKCFPNGRPIDV